MYKLSICIPTYNRSNFLSECIDSLLDSIHSYENLVEVLVLDNSSTDNTRDVMNSICAKYSFIKYFRNSTNIGAEANFFLSAVKAKGRYCLILGDDDKLELSAVKIILNAIEKQKEPALIIMNYSLHSKNFESVLSNSFHNKQNDLYFSNKNSVMDEFGPTLSFISSVVFQREAIGMINIENYDYFKEYGFSFLYMIYDYLSQNETAFYISTPLIRQRTNNSTINIKKFFFIGMPLVFGRLRESGYSKSTLLSAKEQIFEKYLKYHLLSMKLNYINIDDEIKRLTYSILLSRKSRVKAFILLYFPSGFFVFLRMLKRLTT
jgi:abequosyltransferase